MRSLFRPRLGLALGGGAARGLAHVGILRAMVREGVTPDVIVGTSMGALIGGTFAATGDMGEVEERVRRVLGSEQFRKTRLSFFRESRRRRGGILYSVSNLLRRGIVYGVSTLRPSFLPAEEFARSIMQLVPETTIESLPTPFAAVALDLKAGCEVVLRHGDLRQAIMASSSIPGLLPPVERNGRLLIDGGWVDKVPVLPAFFLGADVVVAVDISADLEDTQDFQRAIDVIFRANAVKDAATVGLLNRLADVVLLPAVKEIHWADFTALDYCIEEGDRAATEAAGRIRGALAAGRWRRLTRASLGRRLARRILAGGNGSPAVE